MTEKDTQHKLELWETKKFKQLKKELNRKDKTLAEMASLIALKKTPPNLGGQRGQLIPQETKEQVLSAVQEAVQSGTRKKECCRMIGVSVNTLEHWNTHGAIDRRKGASKTISRMLSTQEELQIPEVGNSKRSRKYKTQTEYE